MCLDVTFAAFRCLLLLVVSDILFGSIKDVVVQQRCCPDDDSAPRTTLLIFSSKTQSPVITVDQVVVEGEGSDVHERLGGGGGAYREGTRWPKKENVIHINREI